MGIEDIGRKAGKIAATAATIAGTVHVVRDDVHGEYESVTVGPLAIFWRDARGNPRILGIPFGRLIRGPRR